MSDETPTPAAPVSDQVILTAALLAGPNATEDEVRAQISRLTAFLQPQSALRAVSTQYDNARTFVSTVIGVGKESHSNRGVVFLASQPNDRRRDGREFFRTARFDDAVFGEDAKALIETATHLIGHKVRVTVANEVRDGNKFRKVVDLAGIERDAGFDPTQQKYQPNTNETRDLDYLTTSHIGTITGAGHETESDRGVIFVTAAPSQRRPDGRGAIRTAPFGAPALGPAARALLNTAAGAIGSKSVVAVKAETDKDGAKTHQVVAITEIEPDTAYNPNAPQYAPNTDEAGALTRLLTVRTQVRPAAA